MDGQEYLNQIAAQARPDKKSKGSKLSEALGSTIGKIAIAGTVLFIIISIIGAILGSNKDAVKIGSTELLLHVNNTQLTISRYQKLVKSSALRSSSASLDSVLGNTSRDLTEYMVAKWKFKEKAKANLEYVAAANEHRAEVEDELFYAKINGFLDRIYAHKMAYEISLIMSQESSVYAKTKDANLRTILEASYDSLENLYAQFNGFSETN